MGLDRADYRLFAGTYTGDSGSDGIYGFDFSEGSLEPRFSVEENDPVFLALDLDNGCLYASSQNEDLERGEIAAYRIDDDELTLLNRKPTGADRRPSHLSIDHSGDHVLAANYEGSVSVLPVEEDGALGDRSDYVEHSGSSAHPRQEGAHPHSVNPLPGEDFVYVPDLGADEVLGYELTGDGRLDELDSSPFEVEQGSGPRHMDFDMQRETAYLLNELDSSITVFDIDPCTGELDRIQAAETLPEGFSDENLAADIHVHPSADFVYASNRGHDSIAGFEIREDGRLEFLDTESTRGESPRSFTLALGNGDYLLVGNRYSDDIGVLEVDRETGELEHTGSTAEVPEPSCLRLLDGD